MGCCALRGRDSPPSPCLSSPSPTPLASSHTATAPPLPPLDRYDVAEWAALKSQVQLASDKGMSQAMFDCDLKGADWNAQLKWGTSNFYGANYFQSVTPALSAGGEVFYLAEQRRRCGRVCLCKLRGPPPCCACAP